MPAAMRLGAAGAHGQGKGLGAGERGALHLLLSNRRIMVLLLNSKGYVRI